MISVSKTILFALSVILILVNAEEQSINKDNTTDSNKVLSSNDVHQNHTENDNPPSAPDHDESDPPRHNIINNRPDDMPEPEAGYEDVGNPSYTAHPESDRPTSTFALEWEEKMKDYEPDYVYMIPVGYKKREIYYENITHVPVIIRGAFLTDEDKKDKIDFEIINPQGHIILINSTNEWIFSFNATEVGFYKIIFHNSYVNSNIRVTFTMNTAQNPMLKKTDLSFVEEKLQNLFQFVKKFQLEFKLTRNNQIERSKKINKTNKYFYTFSVIETIILICISIWQFYYIKQLLEIKSSC